MVSLFRSLCKPLVSAPGLVASSGKNHSMLFKLVDCRLLKHTAPTHALAGGSAMLTYHLIHYWLRHHDHTNMRPLIIDHQIAMGVLGMGFGALGLSGSPYAIFQGFLFSFFLLGPITWWIKLQGNRPGQMNRQPGVYYIPGTTEEEISRFRHQD